jgi:hypothetical protein
MTERFEAEADSPALEVFPLNEGCPVSGRASHVRRELNYWLARKLIHLLRSDAIFKIARDDGLLSAAIVRCSCVSQRTGAVRFSIFLEKNKCRGPCG